MHANRVNVRPDKAAVGTTWSTLAAVVCLGLLLFILAAVIILALIPTYLPQRSATLSTSNRKSSKSGLLISTGSSSGRRRRQANATNPLDGYIGGTVSPASHSMFSSQLGNIAKLNPCIQDLTIDSISIVQISDGGTASTCFFVQYYVFYAPSCPGLTRQNSVGDDVVSKFKDRINSNTLSISNLIVIPSGGGSTITISGSILVLKLFKAYPLRSGSFGPIIIVLPPTIAATTASTASPSLG